MSRATATSPARRRATKAGIVLVLVVAAMLAGCGKKGAPTPPTDEPNTYPRTYPRE
jgi:predicted small lipoprotein YifL